MILKIVSDDCTEFLEGEKIEIRRGAAVGSLLAVVYKGNDEYRMDFQEAYLMEGGKTVEHISALPVVKP